MVVISHPPLNQFFLLPACKPTPTSTTHPFFTGIPEIDLSDPQAKTLIVKASQDFGFFKLVNHGVPLDLMTNLENQALKFFRQPQTEKDRAGPPDPFGYGSKQIGPNGDVGWVEYLLLNTNPEVVSPKSLSIFLENPEIFRRAVEEYTSAVRKMSYEVLELMAEGLGIEPRNAMSKLLRDERSDCCFRVNHYPAWECESEALRREEGKVIIGFGEHTDPQMISVLRSNNTSGLQICLRDGTWVPVPPDHTSFFINVGDTLQVMTNGRFRSVKHRVLAERNKSRVSMIFFGGPPLSAKIAPLPSLMTKPHEESLYEDFTWCEFKNAAYKTRLADNRLALFQKPSSPSPSPSPL